MELKLLVRKFCDYSSFIKGFSKETIKRYDGTVAMFCKYAKVSKLEEVNDDVVRNFSIMAELQENGLPTLLLPIINL